jgi:hypothetical protein
MLPLGDSFRPSCHSELHPLPRDRHPLDS